MDPTVNDRFLEEPPDPDGGSEVEIRLAIVDTHCLFRECLASALAEENGFRIEGLAATGGDLLSSLRPGGMDVLLLGVNGCWEEAAALIGEVRERCPEGKALVLGPREVDSRILGCFEAGARGYLFRDQSLGELRSSILAVARGETVCPPRIAQLLFSRLADLGCARRRRDRLDSLHLTARELEIVRLISDDLSNQEIARRLHLSVHTVKNHIHKVLETLKVESRRQAVRYAVEKGWLPDRHRS
ncbi:MAG: response regulator transcription factor [Acidobacteriota bacterium]